MEPLVTQILPAEKQMRILLSRANIEIVSLVIIENSFVVNYNELIRKQKRSLPPEEGKAVFHIMARRLYAESAC